MRIARQARNSILRDMQIQDGIGSIYHSRHSACTSKMKSQRNSANKGEQQTMATQQTIWLANALPAMASIFHANDNKGAANWAIAQASGDLERKDIQPEDFAAIEGLPIYKSRTAALIDSRNRAEARKGTQKEHIALFYIPERKLKSGTIIPHCWQTAIPLPKASAEDMAKADEEDSKRLKAAVKPVSRPQANGKAARRTKAELKAQSPAQIKALEAEQRKQAALEHAAQAQAAGKAQHE